MEAIIPTLQTRQSRTVLRVVEFGIVLAAVVVVLGAYTRLADAGLGCPDWPGCYGLVGIPDTPEEIARAESAFPDAPVEADKAWTEMIHRYVATGLGALILIVLALAARARMPLGMPLLLTALVIAQGAFGAWTVTLKLWPQIVTLHLLGGFATLALLWSYALMLRRAFSGGTHIARLYPGLASAALAVVILQVALGGWVTSNYAALACPDFPTCHGAWWPAMDFAEGFDLGQDIGPNYLGGEMGSDARVAIQVTHRLGALLVLFVAGPLAWRLRSTRLGTVLAGLLVVQLALGIGNVLLSLPLALAVLHNAFAAALLLGVVTVNFAARGGGTSP